MTNDIEKDLLEALQTLQQFIEDKQQVKNIDNASQMLVDCIKSGGKIMSCGNGGSMSDAMHFAEELSGRFRGERPALPAIAMSDASHITCTANDYGFDYIFSRFVEAIGKPGDVLLAISTSGNSANVLKAAEAAQKMGIKVLALTGKDGGRLANIADIEIRAPKTTYSDRIQEIHIKVIHILIREIEDRLFPSK